MLALMALPFAGGPAIAADESAPIEALTSGPDFHWFGYYDKFQFDPSDRYVLSMEVDFEHRSPTENDAIRVGMIDLEDGNRWIELGESRAWCWQQGCMLQWRPGSETEVLWNDREGDRFVCRIHDIKTGETRTMPRGVYHASPDGKWGLSLDWRRVQEMRPGYGYPGLADPNSDDLAPKDVGVWRVDLETGEDKLLFNIADISVYPKPVEPAAKHYFNHIEWDTVGERFVFLHRWRLDGGPFITRMLSASKDGSDIRLVSDNQGVSHFVWRDPQHVSIWHKGGFHLYKDDGSLKSELQWKASNGHQTYVPRTDNEWMLCDTYPKGDKREQTVYLRHLPTGENVTLGRFPAPKEYKGEWRCDTHPRSNRAGTKVVVDSTHGGEGRQLYMIDIGDALRDARAPTSTPLTRHYRRPLTRKP